jgi:hypothetical protein
MSVQAASATRAAAHYEPRDVSIFDIGGRLSVNWQTVDSSKAVRCERRSWLPRRMTSICTLDSNSNYLHINEAER